MCRAEREQAAGAQHARGFGDRPGGIAEAHRTVIAEHRVERVRGERHGLRACEYERHGTRDGSAVRGRVVELRYREIESDAGRASLRERGRPLRAAAAQLEHHLAGDVAEHVQLGLGSPPRTPCERAGREFLTVHFLVGVGVGIPERAQLRAMCSPVMSNDASPAHESHVQVRATAARWLRSRPVNRNVCVVGVGLADGPVAADLTGMMLQAQAFGRAVDGRGPAEVRRRRARERGIRRDARSAARRVPRDSRRAGSSRRPWVARASSSRRCTPTARSKRATSTRSRSSTATTS